MIPKRIDHDPDCDNYRTLALYIADAALGKTPGEKTIFSRLKTSRPLKAAFRMWTWPRK